MALLFPLLNGHRHDFSSAEINVNGQLFNGIRALNYGHGLDPGELRGNRAPTIGRTRGKYAAEGDMEVYLAEYQQLILTLGSGYMERSFNIVASYNELGQDLVTDMLIGCRIKKASKPFQEGNEPLVVRVELHVMELRENGLSAIDPRQFFRAS